MILNVNLNHDLKEYTDYSIKNKVDELVVINKYNMLGDFNANLNYCMGYYVFSIEMCNNFKAFLEEISDVNISYEVIESFEKRDLFDEHATGLAINIQYDYNYNNLVEEIASRHGFVLRYKNEYFNVCGYEEEGHFRYVGDVSVELYNLQVSLEEYIYLKQ
ncbi:MAG: hypothetical protein ACK5K7_00320 [Bacilli bacterium]